ncbi:TPA: hypothetical protein NPP60_004929 [Klebsiella variicola subsp. variicola]|nr:hypothetical protein [Klebsiella variicola subsp. variicola]
MKAHNPHPKYVLRHNLPPVLAQIFDTWKEQGDQLQRNLQLRARKAGTRCRRFRESRLKACHALMMGLLAHVNLASGMIYTTATDLALACGLTTTGKKGLRSIARATRALYELFRIGLIWYERPAYDPDEGVRDPIFIRILPQFWEMFGQQASYMVKKQQNALVALKRKLTGKQYGHDVSGTWEQEAIEIAKTLYSDLCERNRQRNSKARQLAKARNQQRRKAYADEKRQERKARMTRRSSYPAKPYYDRQPDQLAMPVINDFEDPGIMGDSAFLDMISAALRADEPPTH